jgi:uncharacterized protein (DUF433 family)
MAVATSKYIGKGTYSIVEAAKLAGASYNTVRGWLNPRTGVVPRKFAPERQVISFAELMEIHFIKMFMDQGVHPRAIHAASREASKRFKTEYPFAVKRFDTDGKAIFATLVSKESGGEMIEDLTKGQYVFKTILRPFFKKLDYNRSDISRYWPLGKRGRVSLDPEREFGQPIDTETGVPTKVLFQAVKANKGQTIKQIADWFEVPDAAVRAAVKFEKSLN